MERLCVVIYVLRYIVLPPQKKNYRALIVNVSILLIFLGVNCYICFSFLFSDIHIRLICQVGYQGKMIIIHVQVR